MVRNTLLRKVEQGTSIYSVIHLDLLHKLSGLANDEEERRSIKNSFLGQADKHSTWHYFFLSETLKKFEFYLKT